MAESLYQTDSIELSADDDPMVAWHEHCSVDAYVEDAVAVAKCVLDSVGYDTTRPPNLLIGGFRNTETRAEAGLPVGAMEIRGTAGAADECVIAARVLYHADQLARGMRSGCMVTVGRHMGKLSYYVACAQHLAAWGEAVRQKQRRDERNRRNNAVTHDQRARWWAPWQAQYRELRAAGMSATAARQEIGSRISEEGHRTPDDKTLRKWLPG
jgi:hypothetical protein